MKRTDWLIAICIFAVAIWIRLIALDCDPPSWLSWSAGIFSDEGIYANDARTWVLFHQHIRGNFHSAAVAPLQSLLDTLVFKRYGVSLIHVRLISVFFSIGILLFSWLATLRVYGAKTANILLGILSISAPFVCYNRLALLETPGAFWLTFSLFFTALAAKQKRWKWMSLFWAGILLGIAVIWKGTFLLAAIPLIITVNLYYKRDAIGILLGFTLALGSYYVKWYLPHQRELTRVGHYYLFHQYLPASANGLLENIERGVFTGAGDGVVPYCLHFAWFLFLIPLVFFLNKNIKPIDKVILWTGLIPLLAFMLFSYSPSRYFLIFFVPLTILAARAITLIPITIGNIALVGIALSNIYLLDMSYHNRQYTMRNDAKILATILPNDATVAGQFAPSLCLDNRLRAYYVQKGFCNDRLFDLQTLPITHVLATVTANKKADPWDDKYDDLIYGPGGLRELKLGEKYTLRVYANRFALP